MKQPRRQLKAGVSGGADVPAEGVPTLVIIPRLRTHDDVRSSARLLSRRRKKSVREAHLKLFPAVGHHVLGGTVVEPRIELVDDTAYGRQHANVSASDAQGEARISAP